MSTYLPATVLSVIAASGAGASASAAIVEFSFEATVTSIEATYEGQLPFEVALGDTIGYSYVIDLETPDLDSSAVGGAYEILASSLTIGGQTAWAGDLEFLTVTIPDLVDRFSVVAGDYFGRNDNAVLVLGGPFVFESDDIPVGFDLDEFTLRGLTYGFDAGDEGYFAFSSRVESYSMTVIPGPGGLALSIFLGRYPRRCRDAEAR